MLFSNDDPVAVHTVAMAGFRILRDLPGLPVDDAGEDQGQARARVHLVVDLAGADAPPLPVVDGPRQGVKLLHLEQAPPHLRPQLRLRHVLQHEFGLQRPAELLDEIGGNLVKWGSPSVDESSLAARATLRSQALPGTRESQVNQLGPILCGARCDGARPLPFVRGSEPSDDIRERVKR